FSALSPPELSFYKLSQHVSEVSERERERERESCFCVCFLHRCPNSPSLPHHDLDCRIVHTTLLGEIRSSNSHWWLAASRSNRTVSKPPRRKNSFRSFIFILSFECTIFIPALRQSFC